MINLTHWQHTTHGRTKPFHSTNLFTQPFFIFSASQPQRTSIAIDASYRCVPPDDAAGHITHPQPRPPSIRPFLHTNLFSAPFCLSVFKTQTAQPHGQTDRQTRRRATKPPSAQPVSNSYPIVAILGMDIFRWSLSLSLPFLPPPMLLMGLPSSTSVTWPLSAPSRGGTHSMAR